MNQYQTYILKVASTGEVTRIVFEADNAAEQLHAIVGGWFERISIGGDCSGFDFYCNEEGRLLDLPVNLPISRLYRAEVIVGDVAVEKCDAEGNPKGLEIHECEVLETILQGVGATITRQDGEHECHATK